jgi:hypothetical protein
VNPRLTIAAPSSHERLVVELECVGDKIYSLFTVTKEGAEVCVEFDFTAQGGPRIVFPLKSLLELTEAARLELTETYP